jgi:hypothetical protein
MALFESIARHAGRLANDVQLSVKRARLEGERRVLQRAHRTALETLGERTYELATSGGLTEPRLATQVAAVEGKLIELDANRAEIDELREGDDALAETPGTSEVGEEPHRTNGRGSGAGAGWEAADRFFRRSSND